MTSCVPTSFISKKLQENKINTLPLYSDFSFQLVISKASITPSSLLNITWMYRLYATYRQGPWFTLAQNILYHWKYPLWHISMRNWLLLMGIMEGGVICMLWWCFCECELMCWSMKWLLWGRLVSAHKLHPVTIQLHFHFLHALWSCCCAYCSNTTG